MAKWIDFGNREDVNWSVIEYFIFRYSGILQFDDYEIEKVYDEFVDFKDTLKAFDDSKNKQKSARSNVFWCVKVCIF